MITSITQRRRRQTLAGLTAVLVLGSGAGCASGDPVSAAGEQGQIQRIIGDLSAVALPNGTATVFALSQTGVVRVPDSVRVVLRNLARLSGSAVYKVWLVHPDSVGAGNAFPLAGRYVRRVSSITYDNTGAAVTGPLTMPDSSLTPVSSFAGGEGTITFTTQSYASSGATVADTAFTLLISIEDNASATTPSSRQPFWVRVVRRSTDTNNGGGNLSFGTFRYANGLTAPVPFVPQGRVNGGILGDSVKITYPDTLTNAAGGDSIVQLTGYAFVGSLMQLNLQGLQRPPIGYRYVAYLCRSVDDLCAPTDTSTKFAAAGMLTTQSGTSLSDADVASPDGTLTATRINEAILTHQLPRTGETACTYDRIVLALEPKVGTSGPPLGLTFSGQMPELIRKARSCR